MIHSDINKWSVAAAERYANFGSSLQSLYVLMLTDPGGISARRMNWLTEEGREKAYAFMFQDEQEARSACKLVAENALRMLPRNFAAHVAGETVLRVTQHASDCAAHIYAQVFAQILRDLSFLQMTVASAGMSIRNGSSLRGVSQSKVAFETLRSLESPKFTFRDRQGRSVPVKTYAHAVWRQTLLSVHNETVMIALAEEGVSFASVLKPGETGIEEIGRIGLDGLGDLPSYQEIMASEFHPNSTSYLGLLEDKPNVST